MDEIKTSSKAYYLDDDHNIVDSGKATKMVINEYDENGNMISETWGFVDRFPKEEQKKRNSRGWLGRLIRKKA